MESVIQGGKGKSQHEIKGEKWKKRRKEAKVMNKRNRDRAQNDNMGQGKEGNVENNKKGKEDVDRKIEDVNERDRMEGEGEEEEKDGNHWKGRHNENGKDKGSVTKGGNLEKRGEENANSVINDSNEA